MSVLINMEMPKGCATCPYCDRAWDKPKCKAKSVQGRFMEQRLNLARTRQKWCPLSPVPEHGRLADLDKIENEIAQLAPEDYTTGGIRLILDYAPIVIPASKEGK